MTNNVLKLNEDKSNIIYMYVCVCVCVASPYYSKSLKTPDLQTGESSISHTDLVRNLGIMFDKFINMNDLVLNHFCHRTHLLTVVHVFATSRIYYCNSLLYGIADYNISE